MTSLSLTTTADDPYVAYSYSYPHKSAYRKLDPPVPLRDVWQTERRNALFLYAHIPFCEMRCGFCNLFTQAHADTERVSAYLKTLARQANVVSDLLGDFAISRFALGGGTPTILSPSELESLFDLVENVFGCSPKEIPTSVETSPKTATPDRLKMLRDRGVERVSIGVQSFLDREAHAIGRPQQVREVHSALERLREFPVVNLDLIYGQPGQTLASWDISLTEALQYDPEELFLYPLYVRPKTGVGRHGLNRIAADETKSMYRLARERLLDEGYEQLSMRCFRKPYICSDGPAYCCQRDGMVGLGCGARSYTTHLHYSTPFAVEASAVHRIIGDWIETSDESFAEAHWGIELNEEERKRRFVIQSLLHQSGVSEGAYHAIFETDIRDDFPQLPEWRDIGWLVETNQHWSLTSAGLERSDWIGPAFYSPSRKAELQEFSRC